VDRRVGNMDALSFDMAAANADILCRFVPEVRERQLLCFFPGRGSRIHGP